MSSESYRVGIVSYDGDPPIGGGGRHVAEVTRRLDDVVVWSGRPNEHPNHRAVLGGWSHGFCKQSWMSVWLNARVRRLVRESGLDVLNVHAGPGGLFLLRRPGAKLVVTAHHTYAQQARLVRGQGWKRVFVPFERRTLRLADVVVCVSDDTRDVVVEHYGIARDKTEVIPNGIDTGRFRPDPAVARDAHTVVFLSRLEQRKGIEFLLRTMRGVVARDARIKLLVGGTGSMRAALGQFVRDHGLDDHVEFLGFVPEEDLPDLYRRARCVVVPSVFEGFGIPVLEAMACGATVVGTNVEGIRGLVDDEVTGLLVEYGDENGLADGILRVCRGEFTAPASLAAEVRAKYDWDAVARRYDEVFGRLVSRTTTA